MLVKLFPKAAQFLVFSALALLAACGSAPEREARDPADLAREARSRQTTEDLNVQLSAQANLYSARTAAEAQKEYRVGPGDELSIHVFRVPELQLKERVNPRGSVVLPLVGEFPVGEKTVLEIEPAAETGP